MINNIILGHPEKYYLGLGNSLSNNLIAGQSKQNYLELRTNYLNLKQPIQDKMIAGQSKQTYLRI